MAAKKTAAKTPDDTFATLRGILARHPAIEPRNVVVHAAYVLSVATAEPDKWVRAAAGLAKEMERSNALGVGAVCFHPGSATDGDPKAAAERVAKAITQALKSVDCFWTSRASKEPSHSTSWSSL